MKLLREHSINKVVIDNVVLMPPKKNKQEYNYIYRYLHDNEIVYVGQTTKPLKERINQHCKEVAFLGLTHIQYFAIPKNCHTVDKQVLNKTERFYINLYNPILNIARSSKLDPNDNVIVKVEEHEWLEYTGELRLCFPKFYDIASI